HSANAVATATLARLEEEAVRVAEARTEPQPVGPAAPALAALWTALHDQAAQLLRTASRRPRAWRREQKWSFDPRERRILWKEREELTLPAKGRLAALATLMVTSDAITIACSCGAAGCAHALALVDETLVLLADPERVPEATLVAEELYRPSWSRALTELALQTGAVEKPVQAIEVWWQLEHELRTPTLTAIVKKQTKRGMSNGARIAADRLLDQHGAKLDARDRTIAELLASWTPDQRRGGTFPARAFAAAVDHPRLVDEEEYPVMLAQATLGFTAVISEDGLRIEPAIDGEPMTADLATAASANIATGEPVLVDDKSKGRFVLLELGEDARRLWSVLRKHGDVFPPESHTDLLEQLAKLEAKVPIAIPEALKGTRVEMVPRTVVRLRLQPDATLEVELFVRVAPNTPLYPPGVGPRDVMFVKDGQRAYLRRNRGDEAPRARGHLARLIGPDPEIAEEGPPGCFRIENPDDALALVSRLESGSLDLDGEWVSDPPTVVGTYGVSALRVNVDRDRDWFGITGDLKIESGRIELAV
ncbi:MAG: hypothetical protein ABI175_19240, partial [Polyangiales bacterium]